MQVLHIEDTKTTPEFDVEKPWEPTDSKRITTEKNYNSVRLRGNDL